MMQYRLVPCLHLHHLYYKSNQLRVLNLAIASVNADVGNCSVTTIEMQVISMRPDANVVVVSSSDTCALPV